MTRVHGLGTSQGGTPLEGRSGTTEPGGVRVPLGVAARRVPLSFNTLIHINPPKSKQDSGIRAVRGLTGIGRRSHQHLSLLTWLAL